jgi:hypothetical protein
MRANASALFLGAALSLLLGSPAARAAAADPAAQRDCFRAQYLMRLPNFQSQQFIADVASLQKDIDNSVTPTVDRIAGLRQEADTLRQSEQHDSSRLAVLFTNMGAPKILKAWVAAQETQLSQSAAMTKEEQALDKSDPNTAIILATMDECDAVKTATDAQLPSLGAWLHVSYGPSGLWAADVGELTASLEVSSVAGQAPRLAANLPGHLAASAPAGTPSPVLAALTLLIVPTGNLSGLADTTETIPVATAAKAAAALLAAFQSNDLAAQS